MKIKNHKNCQKKHEYNGFDRMIVIYRIALPLITSVDLYFINALV